MPGSPEASQWHDLPFAPRTSGDRMAAQQFPMKKSLTILLTAAAFIFASTSCDKHSWKETQGLHEGMHKAHGSDHGDSHAKDDGHGKKEEAKH